MCVACGAEQVAGGRWYVVRRDGDFISAQAAPVANGMNDAFKAFE